MKNLFSFVLVLLLFLCSLSAKADNVELMPQEEIVEAPSPYPKSDEAIRYLQGEDMYQGTLSWQGNKASSKFYYEMKKEKN